MNLLNVGENNEAPAKIDEGVYAELFSKKLKTFNNMFKTKISQEKLVSNLVDAWEKLTNESQEKKVEGKRQFSALFEAILEHAFEVEKGIAYNEGRFPDYTEIIRSSNDLVRAAMFSFTDLYRDNSRAPLFGETSFGGMSMDEMVKLTPVHDGVWELDQKSDEAWEIQSKEAKDISNEWLKKSNPYGEMLNEMNNLVEANKHGGLDRKDVLNKLAAAEWLLINNDKMMMDNPDDPINKTPNWNNRYWKAIIQAREAIGIPKFVSMRDLIQGNYSVMQKTIGNVNYHKELIREQIFNEEKRTLADSKEKQNEEFVIQSAKIAENQPLNENHIKDMKMDDVRVRISIVEEDEFLKAKNMPKDMSSFVIEKDKNMEFALGGKN